MADGVNRPMTGIRGAGYPGTAAGSGSASRRGGFDPLNQAVKSAGSGGSPAGLDNSKREETPEDKIKSLEKKVFFVYKQHDFCIKISHVYNNIFEIRVFKFTFIGK